MAKLFNHQALVKAFLLILLTSGVTISFIYSLPAVANPGFVRIGMLTSLLMLALLAVERQGVPGVPQMLVIGLTLITGVTLPEPLNLEATSIGLIIIPLIAQILNLSLPWVVGSFIAIMSILVMRAAGHGVFAEPFTFIAASLVVGLLALNGKRTSNTFARLEKTLAELEVQAAALRSSEERFAKSFEASPLAMAIMTPTEQLLTVNASFVTLTGHDPALVIGQNIAAIGIWEDPLDHLQFNQLVASQGFVHEFETRWQRADGSLFDTTIWAEQMVVDDAPCIFIQFLDVSEQRRLTLFRDIRHLFFKRLATGYPLGEILNTLCESLELYLHDGMCSIMLYEHTQRRLFPALPSTLPPTMTAALDSGIPVDPHAGACGAAAYRRETVISLDIAANRDGLWHTYGTIAKDHDIAACWSIPILNHNQELIGTFAVYYRQSRPPTDEEFEQIVSAAHLAAVAIEQRNAEKALRASEQRHRSLVSAIPDAIFQISSSGDILDYQAPIDASVDTRDLKGRHIDTVMPPALAADALEVIAVTLATNRLQRFEFQLANRYGPREYEARVVANGPAEVFAIIRDITERKRLEEQLLQAHKMEVVGRLAGGIAHDFNNLLVVISGSAAMARELIEPDHEAQIDLHELSRAAERAATLTRQLLAFARRQINAPEVIDLNTLIRDLNRMLRRLISEDIELITDLAPDPCFVRADPSQLEQVLVNLVVNARDAMPNGGTLTISTALAYEHPPHPGPPMVMLTVVDTGIGMDEHTKAHLFEPFFTTKPPQQGTGLGLATSYGIIKQSNGEIAIVSEQGVGTTITIRLPSMLQPLPNTAFEPAQVAADPMRGNEHILVVEDEPGVRELVVRVLQSHGYTVSQAADGHAALLLLSQLPTPPDLLLTDIVMPQMDGITLATLLSAQLPTLRVIYTSGYTEHPVIHEGRLNEQSDFLAKPFTPTTLAQKVRAVLDRPVPPLSSHAANEA